MAMNELFPYMQQAHQLLNDEFEKYARLKESDPDASWAAFMEFLDGLRRHMSLEEEVLFPAYAARPLAGAEGAHAAMRDEHRRILALSDELQICQAEFNPRAISLEADMRALLNAHNEAEEQVFQPWLSTSLNAEELRALLDRMARFGIYVAAPANC